MKRQRLISVTLNYILIKDLDVKVATVSVSTALFFAIQMCNTVLGKAGLEEVIQIEK